VANSSRCWSSFFSESITRSPFGKFWAKGWQTDRHSLVACCFYFFYQQVTCSSYRTDVFSFLWKML
jgi:hypothetical protein